MKNYYSLFTSLLLRKVHGGIVYSLQNVPVINETEVANFDTEEEDDLNQIIDDTMMLILLMHLYILSTRRAITSMTRKTLKRI